MRITLGELRDIIRETVEEQMFESTKEKDELRRKGRKAIDREVQTDAELSKLMDSEPGTRADAAERLEKMRKARASGKISFRK